MCGHDARSDFAVYANPKWCSRRTWNGDPAALSVARKRCEFLAVKRNRSIECWTLTSRYGGLESLFWAFSQNGYETFVVYQIFVAYCKFMLGFGKRAWDICSNIFVVTYFIIILFPRIPQITYNGGEAGQVTIKSRWSRYSQSRLPYVNITVTCRHILHYYHFVCNGTRFQIY